MPFEFMAFSFVAALMAAIGLVALVLTLYVFYDLLFQQPDMDTVEKLVWVLVVLMFNVIGVIVYLVLVVYQDMHLFDSDLFDRPGSGRQQLDELERLQDLHERGALTDEEFEAEKKQLLDEYHEAHEHEDDE